MTHILITDLREIRYITGKIESVPLDPEKDTLPFDREEDLREIETVMYTKWMSDHNYKAPFPLWKKIELKPGIYQVEVEVESICDKGSCAHSGSCYADGLSFETCAAKKVARVVQPKEEPVFENIQEPTGAFILRQSDIHGMQTHNGTYFHYSQVCTLLDRYAKELQGKEVNQ